jgi:acetylglutamate kinase
VTDTFKSRADVSRKPFVIKLGGEVIASPDLPTIAEDINTLTETVGPVVVVHGGGPQATKLQERLGQEVKQVGGRRVTDAETLDVMKMVVAGKLNVDLCAALFAAGAQPVGLHGASAGGAGVSVISAKKRPPRVYPGAGADPVDLGLVGDIVGIGRELVTLLLARSYTPVIACLGADGAGQVYNINADIVANKIAADIKAEGLILISDVPGVLRDVKDPSTRIPSLTLAEGRALIASGVVTKGMIVKLSESFSAIEEGVRRIHIVGRLARGDLLREARSPGSVGTVLIP